MDVVGHELTHGVVQNTSGLVYEAQSGALNEHFADVFGVLVRMFKSKVKADTAKDQAWLIGAGLLVPAPTRKALRSMKDPGSAYSNDPDIGTDPQPQHMNDYMNLPVGEAGDWGGVHVNSGIPNKAFYLAATVVGGFAWEKVGKVWYEVMQNCSLIPSSQMPRANAARSRVACSVQPAQRPRRSTRHGRRWDCRRRPMRVEVLHIAGPIPVRRQGVIEVGSLPAVTRDTVQRAVDAIRTQVSEAGAAPRAHGKGTAPPPIPDVGSSIVTIVDDDGAVTRLKFSEAEATLDQTRLLKALRPFLTIVPWK